jgi:hypothetical protein
MKGQVVDMQASLALNPHKKQAFQLAYRLIGDGILVAGGTWPVDVNGLMLPNGLGGANMPP